MSIKQISVFMENKPGVLGEMTEELAKNNVDLRAISLAEAADFGIARMIVDDLYKATTVLKDAGFVHRLVDVVAVEIPDVPGGLNKVLGCLSGAGVNLEYMYASRGDKEENRAYMILKVEQVTRASDALKEGGFNLVDQDHADEV